MKKKLFLAITIIALNCNMIFAQGYKYNIDSSDGFFSIDNRKTAQKQACFCTAKLLF